MSAVVPWLDFLGVVGSLGKGGVAAQAVKGLGNSTVRATSPTIQRHGKPSGGVPVLQEGGGAEGWRDGRGGGPWAPAPCEPEMAEGQGCMLRFLVPCMLRLYTSQ